MDSNYYSDQERLSDFDDWLGDWLGAGVGERPSYQELYGISSPAPDRMSYSAPGGGPDTAIWTCLATDDPEHGFEATIARIRVAWGNPELQTFNFLIASPDDLGDPALDGISILDAKNWLESWESHRAHAYGIGARLKRLLKQLGTGNANDLPFQYEVLVKDIFRFLFFPGLYDPWSRARQANGAQVRDIIFAIKHHTDNVWEQLALRHAANNLVIEVKNYQDELSTPPGQQLRSYLNPHTPGNLGVLASRHGPNANSLKELKSKATQGVAMLPMSDATLIEMIDAELGLRGSRGSAAAIVDALYNQLMSG
jgi:hypothetical protein